LNQGVKELKFRWHCKECGEHHEGNLLKKAVKVVEEYNLTECIPDIALLDKEGNEIAVIRNIEDLMPESKKVVENCLREYYMIPRITRFIKMSEKFKIWMWTAETDKGICTFEIRNHITAIKPLYDGRVLIKDANDNRYEIPDVNKLDKKSLSMILPKL
jgi:hypothetical protein